MAICDSATPACGASRRVVRVIIVALLVAHSGMLAWMGYHNSPVLDEVAHLPAGISHWQFGTFDLYRVNPPLVRMLAATPVLAVGLKTDWSSYSYSDDPYARPEFPIGQQFIASNGYRSFWLFTLARWACIPLSMLGGWICFRWACDLYGDVAGLLALTLWCFCPNVLAWGSTITPDAGAAALGITAGYLFWRWLQVPSWSRASTAGIALGLVELTKSTWIILFFLWPLLAIIWRWRTITTRQRASKVSELGQLVLILLLGVYLINFGYGFERSFRRLGEYTFISRSLGGDHAHTKPGNRFAGTWMENIPVPLPENYVRGIDVQKADFEDGMWSYLCGEQKLGGWWYYYLYALALKVPLGTWLIGLSAVALTCYSRSCSAGWRNELVLLAPAVVVLVLVSSQTGFSRHLRYVLPAFPFAFVWISKIARAVDLRQRSVITIQATGLAWLVVSSLTVYPHSMSYFNELAGGPTGGHSYLVDSNIDWGQDLLHLRDWLDEHPEAHPLHLAYFGFVDPRVAGIEFEPVPPGPTSAGADIIPPENLGPRPGWYAISVNHLKGYRHYDHDRPIYTYFQRFRPAAMVGYSIYIYHINSDEANSIRCEFGQLRLEAVR